MKYFIALALVVSAIVVSAGSTAARYTASYYNSGGWTWHGGDIPSGNATYSIDVGDGVLFKCEGESDDCFAIEGDYVHFFYASALDYANRDSNSQTPWLKVDKLSGLQ